jgi:hypothetical protein
MEQTQCSETSAIKHHTPENNPKDYTRQVCSNIKEKQTFDTNSDMLISDTFYVIVYVPNFVITL